MKIINVHDFKKLSYKKFELSPVNTDNTILNEHNTNAMQSEKTKKIELDAKKLEKEKKDFYKEIELLKDKGYQEGFDKGYENGKKNFEKNAKEEMNKLEQEKNKFIKFIDTQNVKYINKHKQDILELIKVSINKILLNAVTDETIFCVYFDNLVKMLYEKYKNFKIIMNKNTFNKIQNKVTENIIYEIDDSIENYDFLVSCDDENIEFFLKDQKESICKIFE